jgi:hypothetical protein
MAWQYWLSIPNGFSKLAIVALPAKSGHAEASAERLRFLAQR